MAWHPETPSNPSSVATATHRSKIYKVALETEGAIGKHEPFDLQTATETSRHGSSVLCRMGSL
jgi:hypothetical protein